MPSGNTELYLSQRNLRLDRARGDVVERAADPDGLAGAEPGAVDRHRRVDGALQEFHAHRGLRLSADRTLELLSGDVDRLDRGGQNDGS